MNIRIEIDNTTEVYYVRYKLYELEKVLPGHFVRVSKSTIVNSDKIYSILRNITFSSKVAFRNTHNNMHVLMGAVGLLKCIMCRVSPHMWSAVHYS